MIAAVDIGTTRVTAVAAIATPKGVRVLGSGQSASKGIRKGTVTSISDAASSIRAAVSEAEAAAGKKIKHAMFGISGHHITGSLSSGVVGIGSGRVTQKDRMLAVRSAETIYIPIDREVLHSVPAEFIIDGHGGITDPVGMSGVRLESLLHIITADSRALQDITAAAETAGIGVLRMVFGPVAAAEALLSPAEADAGALIVDIGGGTTDVAYIRNGVLRGISVLGIGGLHLTNDLAVGLGTGIADAELIKISEGAAVLNDSGRDSVVELTVGTGPFRVKKSLISEIIRCRCEELFELVGKRMAELRSGSGLQSVIITGGTAMLPGISALASSVLNMPARVGLPNGLSGLEKGLKSTAHASAAGLLLCAAQEECGRDRDSEDQKECPGIIGKIGAGIKRITGYKDFLGTINRKKKGVSYV